jgi:5S rRNA maturation endonuclease (ribonuclease M5)
MATTKRSCGSQAKKTKLLINLESPLRKSINTRRAFDSAVPGILWKGDQGLGRCPFHDDHRPSLSVDANKGLFFCHSCGAKGNLEQFERKLSGCEGKMAKNRIAKLAHRRGGSNLRPRIVTVYSYKDENGKLRYQQVRFEPKDFRFRRPERNGGWIWNLQGVSMILYRLREVIEAEEVFIAEGEKDVETLRASGFVATCNPGGTGKWRDEYSKYLTDKKVIVLQDDDEPGRKHARAVAESVAECAAEVKLVASFKDAKDITEWMENGGTKKQLKQLVADAAIFERSEAPVSTPIKDQSESLRASDWRAQPLRGAWVIHLLESFFLDYVILPGGMPFVLSLWSIGTRIFNLFDCFPYLMVTSPTKRCGNTRSAEVLELLCARSLMSVSVSEAALFRSIASQQPTVIIDEAEALRNKNSERAQYLLAILHAGFRKGAFVLRCVGKNHEVEKFPVYGPKVVLAIGNLPDTLRDRSILIAMRRRMKDEVVGRFRRRIAAEQATGVVSAVSDWVKEHTEQIAKGYNLQNLDFLQDREAELWEPLFAIASVAVPERLGELKGIALQLSGEKAKFDVDDSVGIKLLANMHEIFEKDRKLSFPTEQLIFKLKGLPESRWEELTPVKLARLLRPFGISPRQLWTGDGNARGYDFKDCKSAFDRYLPPATR